MKTLYHILFGALVVLNFTGCSSVGKIIPDEQIVDVDPESLENNRYGNVKYESTPDHVVVGNKNGILIEVHKIESVYDEQANTDLQVWDVTATNTNKNGLCVTPVWQLMDFEYLSNGASEQYVPPMSIKKLGQMLQQYWIIDGSVVALPPSGLLHSLKVRKPRQVKDGEECLFLTPEEEIDER